MNIKDALFCDTKILPFILYRKYFYTIYLRLTYYYTNVA